MARQKEVSQAGEKRIKSLIKFRESDVKRVRAWALAECNAQGRINNFERRNAISNYLLSRHLLDEDRKLLASVDVVSGYRRYS